MRWLAVLTCAAALLPMLPATAQEAKPVHGMSLYGDPLKYPPDFKHFDYVNPDAPKGGTVKTSANGTFDNLNPFILKGVSFIRFSNDLMKSGQLFDSLMDGTLDEPLTAYGTIAETVEMPADRSWMIFNLRPQARFHDGSPITAEDVVWTYETLITKGHPQYRAIFAGVEKAEVLAERRVKFTLKKDSERDLPMTVAGLTPLPKKWWEGKEFDKPTLEPLLGSGPYRITKVDPGRSITWERVKDWWAKDLPTQKGTSNVDVVQVDYYRESTVAFEAFKAGQIDIHEENTAQNWATKYDFPAIKDGLVTREQVQHEVPQGMQNFAFNTRRPIFEDARVRQALGYLFDFEWMNKSFFYDSYTRTKSYFENSDMAARGLPTGRELTILEKYRGKIPDSVFTTEYKPPVYDGSGNIRDGVREALRLLKEAGWSSKNGKLVNDKTGKPFEFEFLIDDPRFERIVLPYLKNLERIGVTARLRNVDAAQYENRRREYDYDMISIRIGTSLAPGMELREYYGSKSAETPGSLNTSGVRNPVVDELIDLALGAQSRADLIPVIKALDRVLLHNYYGIPNWYSGMYRVAYWAKFKKPPTQPKYASQPATVFPTWWIDPEAEAQIAQKRQKSQ
ncbi:MAG: ABC transporter substrate-binding protein [Alphaproteobacteria bacterium]|nr:ABC transporter substrate-binding protein [Alphaproteobacteria bacterium]